MKIKRHKEQEAKYDTGYEKPLTPQQKLWIIDLLKFKIYLKRKKGWNIEIEDKWYKLPALVEYMKELDEYEDV